MTDISKPISSQSSPKLPLTAPPTTMSQEINQSENEGAKLREAGQHKAADLLEKAAVIQATMNSNGSVSTIK